MQGCNTCRSIVINKLFSYAVKGKKMMCFKSLEIVHMGPCHTYLSKHFIPHTYSLTLILFMFTSIQTRYFIIVISSAINFSVHGGKKTVLLTRRKIYQL